MIREQQQSKSSNGVKMKVAMLKRITGHENKSVPEGFSDLENEFFSEHRTATIKGYENALELIAEAAKSNPDIILAPEFIFYPQVPYSKEEKEIIEKKLAEYSDNRLIIPGTIIWREKCRIYNTAPVIHDRNITEYHKKKDGGTEDIARFHGCEAEYGTENGKIFRWKSLDIGLEVCADHYSGLLKSRKKKVGIHIIIGCGAMINGNKQVAKNKGHVLLCDGCYSNKAAFNDNGLLIEMEPVQKDANIEIYELEI